MKKHEATQHTKIEAWVRHFLKTHAACKVELKHSRGKSTFPFSEVPQHQLDDLEAFNSGCPFVHKFDDSGYRKKPVDIIGVAGGHSFIAIRYIKHVYIISYDVFTFERRKSARKSISEERAKEISFDIIK